MDVLFGNMQRIGLRESRLLAACFPWAILGAIAAAGPAIWMWGFTVDDALVAVRYARHIAVGLGWRFNAYGPSTDGVTPLVWPLVLAPMARAAPLVVLTRSKVAGLAAWTCTGASLGASIGRSTAAPWWGRASALATVALSVPLAAHAVSGMETALATALATAATLLARRPCAAAVLAGLAASLRPEMAPWAFVLAIGAAIVARARTGRMVTAGALAIAPFALCAIVRAVAWGRAAPLAVMAKPSDIDHGLAYAGAACVVTLTPLLVLAPLALRASPIALAIVLAAVAHVGAMVAVGGDWMPYARLMVPVVPALAYAGVVASERARPLATAARSLAAIAVGLALIVRGGTEGRRVGAERSALVGEARPALAGVPCVAALDIGWVGAATEAEIVDLAGLTDPDIAALPGGHTSKRVDSIFLLSRKPGALLLYAPEGLPGDDLEGWSGADYRRVVEARLARDPVIARHFTPARWLPMGTRGAGYVLLIARPTEDR
ncbi:MAG TPA: hypothetical protein VN894_00940 [Polyangiaceae bacterium]|nr:hypothetical protein [Polyangiaceae bacterium]